MSSIPGSVEYILYPVFNELTITWIPPGFSVYIWLDTKIVLKERKKKEHFYIVLHRYVEKD